MYFPCQANSAFDLKPPLFFYCFCTWATEKAMLNCQIIRNTLTLFAALGVIVWLRLWAVFQACNPHTHTRMPAFAVQLILCNWLQHGSFLIIPLEASAMETINRLFGCIAVTKQISSDWKWNFEVPALLTHTWNQQMKVIWMCFHCSMEKCQVSQKETCFMRTNCASPHQFVLPPPLFLTFISIYWRRNQKLLHAL